MNDFSFFIDVAFRIINFFILIFLFRYLFKRFALPWAQRKMEHKRHMTRSLEEHLNAVRHQDEMMASLITQESEQGSQIEKKMVRWADAVTAEFRLRNREKEQLMRKIAAHVDEKEHALIQMKMEEIILPRVLHDVEVMLKEEAADPQLGAYILKRIMKTIKAQKNG